MTLNRSSESARTSPSSWLFGPFNDLPAWERVLQRVNPIWSLTEIRARVVERVEEDCNTVSLWLKPNARWPGHHAGQHVVLGVEMDGALRHRAFSLSTAARPDGLVRITLRRQRPGGVTEWLHRHASVGLCLRLSSPSGSFVLPQKLPDRLLMLAAGSGLTPMMAMLWQLADQNYRGDIQVIQLCRDSGDRLFAAELLDLQSRLPALNIHVHASDQTGRMSFEQLARYVPDWSRRRSFLCGPADWMADVTRRYTESGLSKNLQQERFGAPRPTSTFNGARQISATQSIQVFTQKSDASLLESAEAAGLQPKHGCRAGLCRTCLCKKRVGSVRNLITGQCSDEPDEWVQLCVSVAESDLELDL